MNERHGVGCAPALAPSRPRFDVGEIARIHGPSLLAKGGLSIEQRRVLSALGLCRTAALGGHLDVCADCGHQRPSYNSCRNRHCPKCQALAQHRWLEARRKRLLPVHYFHVVFTIPCELRELVRVNRRQLCALLMKISAATLLDLARDPRHLGAQLGLTAVLHTWSRDLSWHPHVHCVVIGGGLDDDGRWVSTKPGFLFPVRVLGRLFRGKLLDAINSLYLDGRLELVGRLAPLADPRHWKALISKCYSTDWVVYCKPPFGSVEAVFAYLGRYTHRVGISNRRLLDVTDERVVFSTRDGKHTSLPPPVFLRRLLEHALPSGFVRIRHYGLLAPSNVRSRLPSARDQVRLLQGASPRSSSTQVVAAADDADQSGSFASVMQRLTGIDLRRCPKCLSASMQLHLFPLQRAPPK